MSRFSWLIPALLAILAFVSLVVRLLFPHIDFYKDELAHELSQLITMPVTIGTIESSIAGYTPIVTISDITMGDFSEGEDLHFSSLEVKLDVWRSLWERSIVIESLVASDGQLNFVRGKDSMLRLNNADAMFVGSSQNMGRRMDISFRNTRLQWWDQESGKQYLFFAKQLQFIDSGEQYYLKASVELPEILGERLDFVANFTGRLNRPDTWAGQFYLQSESIMIDEWMSAVQNPSEYKGDLKVSAWGDIAQQQGWVAGNFHCRQCVLPGWEEMDVVATLYGEQNAKAWRLALSDITLQTPSISLQQAGLTLMREQASPKINLAVELPHFSNRYVEELYQLPEFGKYRERALLQLETGVLSVVARTTIPQMVGVSKEEFSAALVESISSIESLYAVLQLENAQFTMPQWQQKFDHLSANLYLSRSGSDMAISLNQILLAQGTAQLSGNAGWTVEGDSPGHLKAGMDIKNFSLRNVSEWVPHEKIHPKFSDWLKSAFVQGNIQQGRIEVAGNPADFPFVNKEGHFSAVADIRGMELNHRKHHEPFKNVNARVMIDRVSFLGDVSAFDYYNLHSDQATVQIENILQPYLQAQGAMSGPLEDIIAHLLVAGLLDRESLLAQHINFSGNTNLQVSIGVPLRKTVSKPVEVSGVVQFDRSGVAVPGLDLELSEIRGDLHFDKNGGKSNDLTTVFNGVPLTGSAQPVNNGTMLKMRGDFPVAQLTEKLPPQWRSYFVGTSSWEGQIIIPNPSPAKERDVEFVVRLTSDLNGIAVNLPSPFVKAIDVEVPFELEISAENPETYYRVQYGDFAGGLNYSKGKLLSGNAHFGNMSHSRPEGLYVVSGQISQPVFIDEWLHLKNQLNSQTLLFPFRMDLAINRLVWGKNDLGEGGIQLDLVSQKRWQADVNFKTVQGKISSIALPNKTYLKADMDYVLLPDSDIFSEFGNELSPGSLPAMEVLVKHFQYDDITGEDLRLVARRTGLLNQVFVIDDLSFNAFGIVVSLQGEWQKKITGEQCKFTFGTNGDGYGHLLQSWDITEALKDGQGNFSGRLEWPGSPKDFSVETVSGDIMIKLEKGVIKKVEPGVTRLFGLFSLQEITRRLVLDFGDVLNAGLTFDKMTGTFAIREGNLHTDDFSLVGSALALSLVGRVGLVDRDYDQKMEVIPNLSSGLPVASALLGGPIAAAAVIVVEKITKLGSKFDEVAALQYKIHGSWDDPKVEFLGNKTMSRFSRKNISSWLKKRPRSESGREGK